MRKLLSLVAAVLFAGSMCASVVTLLPTDVTTIESGATSGLDVTLQGVQIVWQGAFYNNEKGADFRVYAGKSMTLSAETNIVKVEIAGLAKKDQVVTVNAGTLTVGAEQFPSETTKADIEDPLLVAEGINAKSITFSCTKQLQARIIRVTLEEADPKGYYLVGNFSEWQIDPDYKMSENPAKAGEYMAEMYLSAKTDENPGTMLKVAYSEDGTNIKTWFPDGMENAFGEHGEIAEDGGYTIYFNPAGGVEGWFEGGIYAELTSKKAIQWEFAKSEYVIYDADGYFDLRLFTSASESWYVEDGDEGSTVHYGDEAGTLLIVDMAYTDLKNLVGTYKPGDATYDLDLSYSYAFTWDGVSEGLTKTTFASGTVAIALNALKDGYNVTINLVGEDGQEYYATVEVPLCEEGGDLEYSDCIDVYSMAKDDEVLLGDVFVTYVNGANVWIKDETASLLIYLPKDVTVDWKAGDILIDVAGVVDIYNGVYEVKPSADQVAAVVVSEGDAPAPEELSTVTVNDMNKYIVMKGVTAEGEFVEGTQSNIEINGVVVRNQFKNGYKFEAGKKYDIVGVVTIYKNNPQVYFISASESESAAQGINNAAVAGKTVKSLRNGTLVIEKAGVKYNAQGAVIR